MTPHPSPNPNLPRRTAIARALASAGCLSISPAEVKGAASLTVANVTGLNSVVVARIETPSSAADIARAVQAWPGKVAIGGGRYSMGGQVAFANGLHLDMRAMNRLIWVRREAKAVRVQAGMRWRDLQDVLDPLNLAVKVMQSYSNFTVGGSVSVNAHGRYVGVGPVGSTVRALQMVLADGSVVEASRNQHAELFRAAIGGYGALGVITEVELDLRDNTRIERIVAEVPLADYVSFFDRQVHADPASILHNADLLPPHFDAPVCVTWRATDKTLTEQARLVARGQSYGLEQNLLWVLTEVPAADRLRKSVLHPLLTARPTVKWLSHEASLDVAELEPRTRRASTYVLQEFFIPRRNFLPFAQALGPALRANHVEAVNVSIRHSPADGTTLLAWAKDEVFSFVLYFKQRTWDTAQAEVGRWTRALIELTLQHDGRYYLPYQLHASQSQFARAYPEIDELRRLKSSFDPAGKFTNSLWAKYL